MSAEKQMVKMVPNSFSRIREQNKYQGHNVKWRTCRNVNRRVTSDVSSKIIPYSRRCHRSSIYAHKDTVGNPKRMKKIAQSIANKDRLYSVAYLI